MHPFKYIAMGLLAGMLGSNTVAQGAAKPNILLILADDLGYHDVGFQGDPQYAPISPNIDTIARDGVRFTQAYVSCNVCAPSRA